MRTFKANLENYLIETFAVICTKVIKSRFALLPMFLVIAI